MPQRYWLFKTEPATFSIDDLAASPDQTTSWEGVRNYQSRNTLRDGVKVGDGVLFYHSSTDVKGIAGICTVVREAYPDPSARDPKSNYHDPKASDQNPIWYVVDVRLVRRLPRVLTLSGLKQNPALAQMMVCKPGARLSIQPVTPSEWKTVMKMIDEMS